MSERLIVDGRPDFDDRGFGITYLKRHPPFVYSLLGGMLVHRVRCVSLHWYEPKGSYMERRQTPRMVYECMCGQRFYGGPLRTKRAQTCVVPAANAVLCGRCNGTGPVFGKGLAELAVKRHEAKRRIGCVAEAE